MERIATMKRLLEQRGGKRGAEGQWPQRRGERRVRKGAVAFARWAGRHGVARCRAALQLGLRPSTLGRWDRGWLRDRLLLRLLGRRTRPLEPSIRVEIAQHIALLGPMAGLPSLQGIFPDVTRRRLQEEQARYRRQWFQGNVIETEELDWIVAGAVWAADFTDPPAPIDGRYENVLAARDLASRMYLDARPILAADGPTTVHAVNMLFVAHGAPLVVKSDNGSPFISEVFRQLLDSFGVTLLLSPPRTPRYNGSAEAGVGSIKTRTFEQAVLHGRSTQWTSDDVEAARGGLNATLRPWGHAGPTPLECWQARNPITPKQRDEFRQCVRQMHSQVLADQELPPMHLLTYNARAAVVRESIRRALLSLGYLVVRKRRISPPFNSPLRDKFR